MQRYLPPGCLGVGEEAVLDRGSDTHPQVLVLEGGRRDGGTPARGPLVANAANREAVHAGAALQRGDGTIPQVVAVLAVKAARPEVDLECLRRSVGRKGAAYVGVVVVVIPVGKPIQADRKRPEVPAIPPGRCWLFGCCRRSCVADLDPGSGRCFDCIRYQTRLDGAGESTPDGILGLGLPRGVAQGVVPPHEAALPEEGERVFTSPAARPLRGDEHMYIRIRAIPDIIHELDLRAKEIEVTPRAVAIQKHTEGVLGS